MALVTSDDCDRFHGGEFPLSQCYDTKGLAEVRGCTPRAQAQEDLCVGVFYDPWKSSGTGEDKSAGPNFAKLASDGASEDDFIKLLQRLTNATQQRSHAKLRRQAEDFLAWLKKHR